MPTVVLSKFIYGIIMIIGARGSVEFICEGTVFRFEKENFDKHVLKRPKIQFELAQLEETLSHPDCLTQGPNAKSKRNYYKIFSYSDGNGVRYVTFWKIPVYYKKRNLAIIATAVYTTSPNFYAVNHLEKILWKNPHSQI